ncbi:uncharacterized protein THITE_2111676 [Thermothielavioides terrestris NRRL 8126]|uniref:Transcription elongation factor Eaf N-terminal domain-containing protein n=1 Tax=Thermothielavioides terrestris (strain ATCC 38088 / NRRL 8126) TaxID=578455 RepID=G2R371_THETT|nr:uncharacterized protein THITE_2111676 [Thermothielavioides terrestris NRRL 8126]AEO65077.1 hypothetical protein THITE_2111676 [Thermothielavioides terrestris NRRL 8126]
MAASGIIDPTKAGKYPVILSDALLGKPSKETYTGIRYNYRPPLSSDTAPETARLKKSPKDESYDLDFEDQGDKYQYSGIRTSNDGNYVLLFDPARKAFVLHRVDSTFHMNLTRTPTDSSAESLRKQFPHLEVKSGSPAKKPRAKATEKARAAKATPTRAKEGNRAPQGSSKPARGGEPEKTQETLLTLPDVNATPPTSASPPSQQAEKKAKRPALSPVDSEEDDDDDGDDVLTLEIPRGNPAAFGPTSNFSTTFRPFSELAREMAGDPEGQEELEEGYEEGDEYDENDEDDDDEPPRRPPIPARPSKTESPVAVEPDRYTFDDGDEDSDEAGGNEALDQDFGELEAELERELQNDGNGSDSSVSEEE